MATDDNLDEWGGFGNWLRSLFSGNGFFGKLLSFLGFGDGQKDSGIERVDIKPSISYDDIQNANTSYDLPASPLEKARKAFEDLKDGRFHYATGINAGSSGAIATLTHTLEKGPDVVHEWLERAGVDASALDPTGRKSADEMEAEIRDAARLGHVARARKYFDAIVSHGDQLQGVGRGLGGLSDNPADIAQLMTAEIEKASQIGLANGQKPVDLSALDPTGTKSSTQMQEEIHRRIVEGYVINARKEFYFLKNAARNAAAHESDDNKTQEWLDKANQAAKEYGLKPVDASVLDPMLKESTTEMNREVLEAIRNKHFEKASQFLYWSQHGGFGAPNPEGDAEAARNELAVANKAALALGEKSIDVSALDPTGGKYRAQVEKDFAAFAAWNTQAIIQRVSREDTAANIVALQNEPALAELIRPKDTPAPPIAQPSRRKQ